MQKNSFLDGYDLKPEILTGRYCSGAYKPMIDNNICNTSWFDVSRYGRINLLKRPVVGIISNPLSGGNRKGLNHIREAVQRRSEVCYVEADTLSGITSALLEFLNRHVNVLVINGGDGTVHAVLTELFRLFPADNMPVLTVLRSGTASMTARDVGLKGDRDTAVSRLFEWIDLRRPAFVKKRSVIRVEYSSAKPLYGMFFGALAICQGIRFCHSRIYTKGLYGEAAEGVTLFRFMLATLAGNDKLLSSASVQVSLDSGPYEENNLLLLFITSLERLFLGLRPFWGNETAPLHYTALGANPRHILCTLPGLLLGHKNSFCRPDYGYFSHNIHEARIILDDGFTIDGELYEFQQAEPVTVKEGGSALFLQI